MNKEQLPGIKLFDLTGKAAIITGGSKGLGFAMAAGLASASFAAPFVCVANHQASFFRWLRC
jgi:NAD(P)-dependent dehydrogenase (short-subunit alcohol dehydrogenase family)